MCKIERYINYIIYMFHMKQKPIKKTITTIQISTNTLRMLRQLKADGLETKSYDEIIVDLIMNRGN
jgi:hypothetical protein